MFTGSILIKQMMLQPMALLQPIPWSHWNWWYRKIFLPWKISIKLNKNRLSNIEVIWPCIGMTKKFFWVKNLNECFDQPSNNKTYTQLSHIFCIRKKKKQNSGRLLSVVISYWWSYWDCSFFFSLFCILGIFNRHLSLF